MSSENPDFLTPSPPCPLYDVIVTIKVALLCPILADPPSPLTWDVLSGWPLMYNGLYMNIVP